MEELNRTLGDLAWLHPRRGTFARYKSKFPPMRTWPLGAPSLRKDQTRSPSDRDEKTTGLYLVGTVLAKRYKVLETIDANSFKAHDLSLDQSVQVRRASLKSHRDGNTWRQKVRQLALIRDPNFLNVIDVIFDKFNDLVVTERPRGRPLADLLRVRSRLDLEDVLRFVTPLAGALDLAATFSGYPHPISARWLFIETNSSLAVNPEREPPSDWPSCLVKLDVWELIRPRTNGIRSFLAPKVESGSTRALAVKQAALLTYELLGGERGKCSQIKRQFKPVVQLSDASNQILCLGLQGSPRFETSESFFHELQSAIRLPAPASRTRESSVALPVPKDIIKSFNRPTRWLATLAAGAVVSAALVLAVLVHYRYPTAGDLKEKAPPAGGDRISNTNAVLLDDGGLKESKTTREITPGQASSSDTAPPPISPKANPAPWTAAAVSAPSPVLEDTPVTSQRNAQANATLSPAEHTPHFLPATRAKIHFVKVKSSALDKSVKAKTRLIALWHQSLARDRKSRSPAASSKLKSGVKKKKSSHSQDGPGN